jgi:hypothetical protein
MINRPGLSRFDGETYHCNLAPDMSGSAFDAYGTTYNSKILLEHCA